MSPAQIEAALRAKFESVLGATMLDRCEHADAGPDHHSPCALCLKDRILARVPAMTQAVAALAEVEGEMWEKWASYVDWLNQTNRGPITLASMHGWQAREEDISEGERRRAELGYNPQVRAAASEWGKR